MSSLVDDAQGIALVIEKFNEMITANYCDIAALTLLIYDYFLTLPGEIRCVWQREFSGVTVLFMLNRYVTLLYRILMVAQLAPFYLYPESTADRICNGMLRFNEVLTIVIELTVAAFMALRLSAVWSSDLKVFYFVLALGLVAPVINIYYYTTISIVATPAPFSGCGEIVNFNVGGGPIISMFNRIFAIVADAIILVLTWIRTADIMRTLRLRVKASLAVMLLRDGTVYFLFLLTLNIINLIAIKAQKFGAVPAISDVVTSILISRFLLNLRGIYHGSNDTPASFHPSRMSDLRFAHGITGNLGAPLSTSRFDHDESDDQEPEQVFSRDPMMVGIPHEEATESGASAILPILFERDSDTLMSPGSSLRKIQLFDEDVLHEDTEVRTIDMV